MTVEELKEKVESLLKIFPDMTFTLESGRGETYQNNEPTLYGHDVYEKSSVLAGQPKRMFIARWPDSQWSKAREALLQAGVAFEEIEGTTHIPSSILCAGLPGEDDLG